MMKTQTKSIRKTLINYLVSAPSLILIALIVVFPIAYTGYISLTNMNTYHWFEFDVIGFDNYARAVSVFDSGFLSALFGTVLWTIANVVLQLVIAFVIANLLNVRRLKLRNVYKTILMFPWAMPGYVSILLWKTGMFNSEFGLLTKWMRDLTGISVRWLSTDAGAFLTCTLVNLWLALPFMIMIMDGGLKSIDRSYYESAYLDGAGVIRQAISITVPCLKPVIAPSVLITVFTTFKQFDVVYLMTLRVGAQTGSHFHTIITYAYENAFITNNYGYSSAISIMIFALLIAFSFATGAKRKGEAA